jgi:hypothetical protein
MAIILAALNLVAIIAGIDVFRVCLKFWVRAVQQIHWRKLEAFWITSAIFLPQRDTNGAGEWFFVARQ